RGLLAAAMVVGVTVAEEQPAIALPVPADSSRSRPAPSSVLDEADRRPRTEAYRLLGLGPQLLGRVLDQHPRLVVVTELEDLRGHVHAARVALAGVEVDDHPHLNP